MNEVLTDKMMIRSYGLLFLLLTACLLTHAAESSPKGKPGARNVATPYHYAQQPDSSLQAKLDQLATSVEIGNNCTYRGSVRITELGKPGGNVFAEIEFCKHGEDCYYHYGPTELFNSDGFYVYISHERKSVFVTRQKRIDVPPVADAAMLDSWTKRGKYTISKTQKGPVATISLVNEKHPVCREYAIGYNSSDGKVKYIHTTLASKTEPLNRQKGTVIDMEILNWSNAADLKKYPGWHDVIAIRNGRIELLEKYKNYKLISPLTRS
ncbi:hypothetical protein AAFN85_13790 [Mucilaginibacter sp. CAU 1740]|uniref:hypothetical protein n=1 Tax=Mucilaginibacter sp. CAU 1740 TaxID=3140365 RepID=UPI00325B5BA8